MYYLPYREQSEWFSYFRATYGACLLRSHCAPGAHAPGAHVSCVFACRVLRSLGAVYGCCVLTLRARARRALALRNISWRVSICRFWSLVLHMAPARSPTRLARISLDIEMTILTL